MASRCPACGQETLEKRRGDFRFDPPPNIPGGTMIIPDAEWRECSACGGRILPASLSKVLDDEARRRQGLLTPDEIRGVRERTGLSQEEMARFLSVGDKTYTRWESGRSYHNKSSDNLIRLVDKYPAILSLLEARRRPDRSALISQYMKTLGTLKGRERTAVAAHGAELDARISEALQRRLREITQCQQAGQG